MGMYTEFFFTAQLKGLDEAAMVALNHMTNGGDRPSDLPDHPLFGTDRWGSLFRGSSHYFTPRAMTLFEYDHISETWCLISYSSLKNYDGEIEKFMDWIKPYLDTCEGDLIGYRRYEEDEKPILHFA